MKLSYFTLYRDIVRQQLIKDEKTHVNCQKQSLMLYYHRPILKRFFYYFDHISIEDMSQKMLSLLAKPAQNGFCLLSNVSKDTNKC